MSNLAIVASIKDQNWIVAAQAVKILKALNENGGQPQALFVGGCIRNALLGEAVEDIDIATAHPPEVTIEKLEASGFKVIPTGIDHGTVTAILDDVKFEVTTLRKDIDTDGRHASVEFTDDWRADAERRDFTMNTLLADGEGQVYDPLGQGLEDLKAGQVVFVGDPAQRIAEDYLRILRFFRFHTLYGQGAPDQDALAACQNAATKIAELSKERVTAEFFKILSSNNAADTLQLMWAHDVLKNFKFKSYDAETLKHLCEFQSRYGLEFIASRLFAICGFDKSNLSRLDEYLLIPKVFKKDVEAIDGVLGLPDMSDEHVVKVAVYKYGRIASAQSLIIELVQDRVMNGYAPKALEIIQSWDVPDFPLSGEDLIKEGYEPGPDLGAELQRREEEWIESCF